MAWIVRSCRAKPGFNGAAAIQPRKSTTVQYDIEAVDWLQWGRGNSAAEIARLLSRRSQNEVLQWGRGNSAAEINDVPKEDAIMRYASMGPRQFSRGNRSVEAAD